MRKFLIICVVSMTMFGCHRDKSVSGAAEKYYGYLMKGDVDRYVKGIAYYDSLPDDYRSQMHDLMAEHIERERQRYGGIVMARALHDTLLDANNARVFIEVTYADSTREQVMLPMVLTEKGWRLK